MCKKTVIAIKILKKMLYMCIFSHFCFFIVKSCKNSKIKTPDKQDLQEFK